MLNVRQHNASFKSSAVSFKRMLGGVTRCPPDKAGDEKIEPHEGREVHDNRQHHDNASRIPSRSLDQTHHQLGWEKH